MNTLPGTTKQQKILEAILTYYAEDERILAIVLFGSLGRGNWDEYSDLDLDIVTADSVITDARLELKQLCEALKQQLNLDALIIADEEEGDVVLNNLAEFSIRYHPLHDTKPAILDTMMHLTGTTTGEQIQAAGEANREKYQPPEPELEAIINQYVRYVLELHNAIERNRLWSCLEFLHRIRLLLMQTYTIRHDGERGLQYFEQYAPSELQEKLAHLVVEPDLKAIKSALPLTIQLLQENIGLFCGNDYELTEQQSMILENLP